MGYVNVAGLQWRVMLRLRLEDDAWWRGRLWFSEDGGTEVWDKEELFAPTPEDLLRHARSLGTDELIRRFSYSYDERRRYFALRALTDDLLDKARALNRLAVRAAAGELGPERAKAELDRIQQEISYHRRTQKMLAVILLDLDNFKRVNDTLGHHHGDLLLQQVATRLREQTRASDVVTRLGGDEFAVLMPSPYDLDECIAVARRLLEGLQGPMPIAGADVDVRASVGIAIAPVFTRPPALLAMSALSVHQASGGRFVLGLGASSPVIVEGWGTRDGGWVAPSPCQPPSWLVLRQTVQRRYPLTALQRAYLKRIADPQVVYNALRRHV